MCLKKLQLVLGRVENIVGKEENAGYKDFLLFPQCFLKFSFLDALKARIVWKRVNPFPNDKFYTLPNLTSLQMTILNLMKMA